MTDARIPDHCAWAARGRWREAYDAAEPIAYKNLPVVLWPSAETLIEMKSPLGRGPGGGYAA